MIPATPTIRQPLTTKQMTEIVEARLREINEATATLLHDIDTAWDGVADAMRFEASRLNEIGFVLTRCLCHGDVVLAYGMVNGEPDEIGTSIGIAV